MKKIFSILLAFTMLFSLVSCSINGDKVNNDESIDKGVDGKPDSVTNNVLDELATVTFTLPKIGEEPVETELTDEEKEAGFISVVVSDDGSSTYTMKKSAWLEYLEELRTTGLDSIVNTSEDGYDSIYSYEINEDLDVATIYVDYDKYKSGGDSFAMLGVHMMMTLIQYIKGETEDTIAYTVNIADYQTKEIKDTINMPE